MYSILLPVQAEGKKIEGSADLDNHGQIAVYNIVVYVSVKAVKTVDKDAEVSADLANHGQYYICNVMAV
jgi:hypothetical protein